MGLFTRKSRPEPAEPVWSQRAPTEPDETVPEDQDATPASEPLGQAEQDRVAAAVQKLQEQGVDIDDLDSLSTGLDTAYAQWATTRAADHSAIVDRYAFGIGEHLSRHTDLDWRVVTDVFGTDLGLLDGPRGSFMVVPGNLVAGRWMRGETGWIPAVVGHLVRCRER